MRTVIIATVFAVITIEAAFGQQTEVPIDTSTVSETAVNDTVVNSQTVEIPDSLTFNRPVRL